MRILGVSGCVESGVFGKEVYIFIGYFNLLKIFEIIFNNGVDLRIGKKIGFEIGDLRDFKSFEEFWEVFMK